MNILEIPLYLRRGKLIFYIFAMSFLTLVLALLGPGLFDAKFDWSVACGLLLLLVGMGYMVKSVYDGLLMRKPLLIVAVKDHKIVFYIRHSKGTANASQEIDLSEMQRFYTVKTRSRVLISDISFEFVPKSGYLRKRVDPLPDLLKIDKFDIPRILQFVQEMAPEIATGYDGGVIAQVFKK